MNCAWVGIMKKIILSLAFISSAFIVSEASADHSPKKMMRNIAYSQLSVIGKLGPFNVNFEKFGELPNLTNTNLNNKKFERVLSDKFNLYGHSNE